MLRSQHWKVLLGRETAADHVVQCEIHIERRMPIVVCCSPLRPRPCAAPVVFVSTARGSCQGGCRPDGSFVWRDAANLLLCCRGASTNCDSFGTYSCRPSDTPQHLCQGIPGVASGVGPDPPPWVGCEREHICICWTSLMICCNHFCVILLSKHIQQAAARKKCDRACYMGCLIASKV